MGDTRGTKSVSDAPAIVDVVMATRPRRRPRSLAWALTIGLLVHAGIALAAWRVGQPLDAWATDLAAKVHRDLHRVEVMPEPERPPEPPPPPPPVPEDTPPPPEPVPELSPPPAADATPPKRAAPKRAPAKAGRVLASAKSSPLDLTDFVSGDGPMYAGGSTASDGTSSSAVDGPVAPTQAPPPKPAPKPDERPSRARPPKPSAADWDCPWPRAADRLEINEASAVVRVQVDARGRAGAVEVVRDPGHGFGAAAIACAKRARFRPARDERGARTPALSPPIRVRFTR